MASSLCSTRTCFDENAIQWQLFDDVQIRLTLHRTAIQTNVIAQADELQCFLDCAIERMDLFGQVSQVPGCGVSLTTPPAVICSRYFDRMPYRSCDAARL